MSTVRTPKLCLRCWFFKDGRCVKGPQDYCKITKSKS